MNARIAIVGAACRYPDADSPNELWENVLANRRAFRKMPSERLSADYISSDLSNPDTTYVDQAAVLKNYQFDREGYRISGRTFRQADMTHWLALDTAADALADAGWPNGDGIAKDNTAVILGNSLTGEFSRANLMRLRWPYVRKTIDAQLESRGWTSDDRSELLAELEQRYKAPFPEVGDETLAGGLANTIAGRICNHFDFHGGGFTMDAACASSLLATSNGCTALTVGDADIVLAGGVDLSLDPFELIGFAKVGALAKEDMRVFDRRSAGFWPGEGCGFVVLMREEDAIAQNRRIYALIRGWGVSSDGSGGITRPDVQGQKMALQRAYKKAGFDAGSVAYFEGHGTGTTVGDATELKTLTEFRRENGNAESVPAVVGSIKANIGHTKAASGVAGLLKATWAIHERVIPQGTNCDQPHDELTNPESDVDVARQPRSWPMGKPMRAGVSGMGFGGINVHLVLEGTGRAKRSVVDNRSIEAARSAQDVELFLFSSTDKAGLSQRLAQVGGYAGQLSRAELVDLSAELSRRTRPAKFRAAVLASTAEELSDGIARLRQRLADAEDQLADVGFDDGVMLNGQSDGAKSIGFIFPGQSSPSNVDGGIWRRRFECVDELYSTPILDSSEDLTRTDGVDDSATHIAQPAIMRAAIAGLRLMETLRVNARAAIGNSLGELAAYHWSGAYDESTLMAMARSRGQAMWKCDGKSGAMASLAASHDAVQPLLADQPVVISGCNSPTQTIVSGEAAAVQNVIRKAEENGIQAIELRVSHAFHSPLVGDAVRPFIDSLSRVELSQLERPVFSTITGDKLERGANLFALLEKQITSPVRFMDALVSADSDVDLWIEVGPGQIMQRIAKDTINTPVLSLDCCGNSVRGAMEVIGSLFVLGTSIDHRAVLQRRFTRPFDLNWQASFLASPCELTESAQNPSAQVPATNIAKPSTTNGATNPSSDGNGRAAVQTSRDLDSNRVDQLAGAEFDGENGGDVEPSDPGSNRTSPLEVVRNLVAEHAELSAATVQDDDRLLSDLHLSSIAVGQIVVSAARALDLPAPASPTDYATSSVAEVAAALEEQQKTGVTASESSSIPDGVETWVRSFEVELVEQPLPQQTPTQPQLETATWEVVGAIDLTLSVEIIQTLEEKVAGGGVVVCLPPDDDEQNVDLLLQAAKSKLLRAEGARFVVLQSGRVGASFGRTFHLENPNIATYVLHFPHGHANSADWLAAELQFHGGYVEAHYDSNGARRVPQLSALPLSTKGDVPLDGSDVLLITGGAKGIAAECALKLAQDTGVRLALLGRSDETDSTVAANLKRIQATGAKCQYWSVDVTDATAMANTLADITHQIGPITGFVHGAGSNEPKLISSLERADFDRTFGPKLKGLDHVLNNIDPQQLKLLVTFGSIIARLGMPGEADYALANEWLADRTELWREQHPHCRCLAIEWSVWSGVGMGERLGRIDALKQQGITAITPDEGVRIMNELISQDQNENTPVSIVVAGRFGQPPTLSMRKVNLPFHRFVEDPKVHIPGIELIVDSKLSVATDPYLLDHAFQGIPLLPAVIGLEAMAQTCDSLMPERNAEVYEFQNIEFDKPIAVPKAGDETIRIAAVNKSTGVELALRCGETNFKSDHFRARCVLRDGTEWDTQSRLELNRSTKTQGELDPSTDLYGGILFHAGRFKRVAGYQHLRSTECIATIDLIENDDWFRGYSGSETLLGDPALHDATIHAIQACIPHGTILPTGADRIAFYSKPQGERCFVYAKERLQDGDRFVYDIEVIDESGNVCQRWDGLRLRKVSQQAPTQGWATPLLTTYMQRRVQELVDSTTPELAMRCNGKPNSAGVRDELIREIGVTGEVHYRPDGKPVADCGRELSVSHHGALTFVVGSDRPTACDVENVAARSLDDWRDLLGSERMSLAESIAGRAEEPIDEAATRVWTALECLKKHGSPMETPLVLRSSSSDGWLTISSGAISIATCITRVRNFDDGKVVFAVLCEAEGTDDESHERNRLPTPEQLDQTPTP